MPSNMDYMDMYGGRPPALFQADAALERGDINSELALEYALALKRLQGRIIPEIRNEFAAKGSYHSGSTAVRVAQATEDVADEQNRRQVEKQRRLNEILRNSYLGTTGMRM